MRRLFGCTVSLLYEDARGEATLNAPMPSHGVLVERAPAGRALIMGEQDRAWRGLLQRDHPLPIPIDLNNPARDEAVAARPGLYLWLTYRTFGLKRPLRLTWPQLYRQFGVDPAKASDKATLSNFRTDCLRELQKIKRAWPDLHYQTVKGALLLSPSPPRIAPSQLRLVDAWETTHTQS